MQPWPTALGVLALGNDREATLDRARQLARDKRAQSVIAHVAAPGQDRHYVSVLRATGPVEELAKEIESIADVGLWITEFRHVKAYARDWPLDTETPGVGLVFAMWRHPELTHEEFDEHWRDTHAPLAVQHHVGMWDYTQCSFRGAWSGTNADYDGVAICQFPSERDLRERFFPDAAAERAINEDVVKFGDPARLHRALMQEYVLR